MYKVAKEIITREIRKIKLDYIISVFIGMNLTKKFDIVHSKSRWYWKVTVEDGEKFVFETQRRNEPEYDDFVRCSVKLFLL